MNYESISPQESEIDVLPEGFDRFPLMISLREDLLRQASDPLGLNHTFEKHIDMLHRTLPDEVLSQTASYHILRGDYDKALKAERFDLEGEDYSICDFLKSLQ